MEKLTLSLKYILNITRCFLRLTVINPYFFIYFFIFLMEKVRARLGNIEKIRLNDENKKVNRSILAFFPVTVQEIRKL